MQPVDIDKAQLNGEEPSEVRRKMLDLVLGKIQKAQQALEDDNDDKEENQASAKGSCFINTC